jgi:DNA processing protein
MLAVVGARDSTPYGESVISHLLPPLINRGITITSGLAYGIDAMAHTETVRTHGRTIAVVAGGLDEKSLYPQAHLYLSRKILRNNGAIISEYPPGTPALKHHFIARNRIISGLSMGTLIIECKQKSGALITARYALEQNRNIYAVPGSILTPHSAGPNQLIQQGATPVTCAGDILQDLAVP